MMNAVGDSSRRLEALQDLLNQPQPTLGIDIDGVVDEARMFFNMLSHIWPGKVVIVSARSDREKAVADLQRFRIRFDKLVLVDSLGAKAAAISAEGISVFFDDQPEALQGIPEHVKVFLVRNGGNFDFAADKWMFSSKTGRMVH